jgi:uncharacterized protein
VSVSVTSDNFAEEDLCLVCGMCCNGAIFARVKVQPEDDVERLRSFGLPVVKARRAQSKSASPAAVLTFKQPCAAFDGCCCRIYAERPSYCRQFECLLLKSVKAGSRGTISALKIIREARERTEVVRQLLRALGETDEQTALSDRFRRTARRLEKMGTDRQTAAIFGDLTVAIHDLNLLFSEYFYSEG